MELPFYSVEERIASTIGSGNECVRVLPAGIRVEFEGDVQQSHSQASAAARHLR